MEFKGMELDFDIFDDKTADAYDEAVKNVQAAVVVGKKDGESLGDVIRRQCYTIFDFFDDIFGDGFHKQLFGGKTNLKECIKAFTDFNKAVTEQKATLDTLMQEIAAESPADAIPNRAARRAAARAVQQ